MSDEPVILLVDDDENDVELMRRAFQSAKFPGPVRVVRQGEAAIAYLSGEGAYSDRGQFPLPAVMLLDLNMPKKNGFDVLAWLNTQPGLNRLMVIVLTASRRPEDADRAYDLGAKAFLVKPDNFNDLIAMSRCLREWIGFNYFPCLK